MTATLYLLPSAAPAPADPGIHLTEEEVRQASGGYKRPTEQLRELHARGFTRATRSKISGRIELERAHYQAVVRGQFTQTEAAQPAASTPPAPDRAGLRQFFKQKRKQ